MTVALELQNANMTCGPLLTPLEPSFSVARARYGKTLRGRGKGLEPKIRKALKDENDASGLDAIVKAVGADKAKVKAALEDMVDVGLHKNGDYILDDSAEVDVKKSS